MFEDVHWAAETFLTLVEHLVEAAEAPILIVCTARPDLLESHPAWSQGPASARVPLHALSAEDAGAVAANLLGGNLDEAARDRIADAADGNPLFVEQMVSMLIDTGVLRRGGRGVGRSRGPVRARTCPPPSRPCWRRGSIASAAPNAA